MLTKNHAQESLSVAYMHAVAATARVHMTMGGSFDYGIDGSFDLIDVVDSVDRRGKVRKVHRNARCPISFQLKSSTKWKIAGDDILWPMESNDYNKLVYEGTHIVPIILILLCLPKSESEWADFSEDALALKKCCYFAVLRGEPIPQHDTTRQIRIPRSDLLNGTKLRDMLETHRERLKQLGG
ncbi:DUF4365 domain-containing protein [Rhizobium ruizarguesonis]|uniref:DUF4365 domain-containing protein n=1 Tax=Rhizobium ruizarguesonis TaxID=2081791 RepID=UPI001FDF6315|nr:DUF4365 domain-containing protein [Rhizobium ruizarguesonis]